MNSEIQKKPQKPTPTFKWQFMSGILYTAVSKYSGFVVLIIVTAILARILRPEDFGLIAVATIFLNFISLITISGISPAIVQNQSLSKTDINGLYVFTIYLGIVAALLFLFISPLISLFYGDNRLIPICACLAFNIAFACFNIVPNALFFKNKQFKFIAVRTLIIQIVLGIVSIVGAFYGWGIYSLLVNPMGTAFFTYIVSIRVYPIPFKWNMPMAQSVRKVFSFSIYQSLYYIINYAYQNIDKLLIGRYFGMVSLGYYEKSYRLMMIPLGNINGVISPVLHPLLAEHQNNLDFIRQKYEKTADFFAYIGFPLSALMFFCSEEIVLLFFGNQWTAAVPIFQIFSVSVGIQLIQAAIGVVFQATNQVKKLFFSSVAVFIVMLFAIIVGLLSKSLVILAIYIVCAFHLAFFIYHFVLIRSVLKSSLLKFLGNLLRPIAITCIIVIFLAAYQYFSPISNLILNLFIKTTITCIIYLFTIKIGFARNFVFTDIKKHFLHR